jgi:hypothetical protein
VEWLLAQSHSALVTSGRRSSTLQRKLYRRFLNGVHPFPVLPPGRSKHEIGLAVDLWGPDEELARLGAIWRKAGGVWGGERDPIHFEPGPSMLRRSRPT